MPSCLPQDTWALFSLPLGNPKGSFIVSPIHSFSHSIKTVTSRARNQAVQILVYGLSSQWALSQGEKRQCRSVLYNPTERKGNTEEDWGTSLREREWCFLRVQAPALCPLAGPFWVSLRKCPMNWNPPEPDGDYFPWWDLESYKIMSEFFVRKKNNQFRGDLSKFHSQLTISFVPFEDLTQKGSVTPLHRCRSLGPGVGVQTLGEGLCRGRAQRDLSRNSWGPGMKVKRRHSFRQPLKGPHPCRRREEGCLSLLFFHV